MNIALIIARKNSKRIPNKNKKKFCGKPIIFWPIKNSLKSNIFDKVYVSTDDKSLSKLGKKYGANVPFLRDKKLGGEKISTIKVVKDFIKKIVRKDKLKIKNLCCIYASAPFFTVKDLKESLNKLKSTKADFSFIAYQIENLSLRSFYFKKKKIVLFNNQFKNFRSQDLPASFIDAGQFYWGNVNSWINKDSIYSSSTTAIVRDNNFYIDINDKKDWKKAEKIFKKRKF
jgi:pseudaminic acid cytidylyltransferase